MPKFDLNNCIKQYEKDFRGFLDEYLEERPMIELEDWIIDILEEFYNEGWSQGREYGYEEREL